MSASNSTSSIAVRRGVGEPLLDRQQFAAQHLDQPGARAQDLEIAGDLGDQAAQFLGDLVALQPGQALQAQIEDGARLLFRQPIGAVGGDLAAGLADQRDERARHRRPARRRPIRPARAVAGSGAARISAMTSSRLATATEQPEQHMRPLARLAEQMARAPGDHLLAEGDEGGDDVAQGQ